MLTAQAAEARNGKITASRVAAWATGDAAKRLRVVEEIRGIAPPFERTVYMDRGNAWEPRIIDMLDFEVEEQQRQHVDGDLLATIDGVTLIDGERVAVEIKTRTLWGKLSEALIEKYAAQTRWQMMLADCVRGVVVVAYVDDDQTDVRLWTEQTSEVAAGRRSDDDISWDQIYPGHALRSHPVMFDVARDDEWCLAIAAEIRAAVADPSFGLIDASALTVPHGDALEGVLRDAVAAQKMVAFHTKAAGDWRKKLDVALSLLEVAAQELGEHVYVPGVGRTAMVESRKRFDEEAAIAAFPDQVSTSSKSTLVGSERKPFMVEGELKFGIVAE